MCCPAPLSLWKSFRDQAERGSGIGLKLFGFIAESVFTFIPEHCSGSPRNTVRNHPGIAFTLDRNPHLAANGWGVSPQLVYFPHKPVSHLAARF